MARRERGRLLLICGLLCLLVSGTSGVPQTTKKQVGSGSSCAQRIASCYARGGFPCQRHPSAVVPCTVTCLSLSRICDGVVQCPLGDDEMNCPTSITPSSFTTSTSTTRTTTTRVLVTTLHPVVIIDSHESGTASTSQVVMATTGSVVSANQTVTSGATVCLSTQIVNVTNSVATTTQQICTMTSQVVQLTVTASAACTHTQVFPING